jgi:hypothetical protein
MKPTNRENRWKRGDLHPFSGLVFWAYIPRCKNGERWVSDEKFKELSAKSNITYQREYYSVNRRAFSEYKSANKERSNQLRRDRVSSDPLYAMKCRLRARMHKLLKSRGMNKDTLTVSAIGCNWSTLVSHIERQFTKGMSWENRDKWHLDHIVPLGTADTKEELLRRCNYMNIRPMWANENMSKGSKTEEFLLTA